MPTHTTRELNVNLLPPRERHATIFRTLDQLVTGESLRLIVDHDPAPLRYQLAAERADQFDWSYDEQGPEIWQVVIVRR